MSESRRPPTVIKVPLPSLRLRATQPTAPEQVVREFAEGTDPELHTIPATGPLADTREKLSSHDVTVQLRDLEDKLARCVATIAMHFQPIVHASSRARFGYEALLRTTDKALPHPGAILDAAERLERVPTLGRAVRAQIASIVAESPVERGMVFLNLHLHDLLDKQLTSAFAPLTKVAPRIVLEITERTSLAGHSDVRYRVAELRELGFKIAIDDLGGGHARMGALTPLDTDFVKLDMSLVRDIEKQPLKQRLIRSMIELCRDAGIQVIGEGVETEPEARTLVDLGCDLLQGYLIARPGPPFVDPL